MRQLSSSSGHPESASGKGRVKIPGSFMVNGNMDTTPHFIRWSMHQISEVQKHNLTSRNFKFNAKKDHHHSLTSHCPLSKCPTFVLLSCVPLVQFFSGHSNTSWCILVFCLCVFVMLCLLYLIVSCPFFPLRFWASFTWFVYAWQLGHSSMKPPKWWSFWASAARQPGSKLPWKKHLTTTLRDVGHAM